MRKHKFQKLKEFTMRRSLSHFSNQTLVSILVTLFSLFILLVSSNKEHATSTTTTAQQRQEIGTTKPQVNRFIVMTVANDPNSEAFKRFNRSIETYGLELVVLGFPNLQEKIGNNNNNNKENSVDSTSSIVGEQRKLELYRKALAVYRNEPNLVLMIVDSDNLIINGDKKDILQRFEKFGPKTNVVFGADARCWPDPKLESKYPIPKGGGERFLLSGAFIGYAQTIWDILNPPTTNDISAPLPYESDETTTSAQLYFTNIYLNAELRQKFAIELDHRGELIQNLHSIDGDVELEFLPDGVKLKNLAYHTEPVVVYGTGASRVVLNSLGNYLGKAYTVKEGCRHCNDSMISLASVKDNELPKILLGLFIEEPTPFLDDFFDSIHLLAYPKNKIHLFIHNTIEFHDGQLNQFLKHFGEEYASKQVIKSYDNSTQFNSDEGHWRTYALGKCVKLDCDYYLSLDSVARLDLPETLRILIETNRTIVAPLLSRPTKLWSNFWASLTADGYYARSHDYVELVKRDRVGIWNVPHIMNAYLINGKFLRDHHVGKQEETNDHTTINPLNKNNSQRKNLIDLSTTSSPIINNNLHTIKLTYYESNIPKLLSQKPVLVFTQKLRALGVFQHMVNTHEFGHLVDPTSYNLSLRHPDFYQLKDNMLDWEQRYLHDNFSQVLEDDTRLEEPCQDVYWFPLVNDLFCKQMIEIMEEYGHWSGGTNDDPRIEGGYESVPTRDIHMKQVGLHEMWLLFLKEYIMPVQLKEYIGYEHDPPRADLAFVVRYHPAEQASLRPHHDSSTYTLNIALNSPQVDYEGGGCKFIRYNCSVTQSRKGWALIHPGRLTHYHEGLPVTNGTRYIMVTFIDP